MQKKIKARKAIPYLITVLCIFISYCDSVFDSKSADCVLVGSVTAQEDHEGDIKFLGEIQNNGNGKALFVRISFTMKDVAGNVIGTDFTYVNSTDLEPGQISSFECWTETPYTDIDSWTYEITWQDDD